MGGVLDRAVFHYRLATAAEQEERVRRVLGTGALDAISGDEVALFEREAAGSLGRAGAVAVSSGSAGLALVLRALGVGPGERVVVPEYAWVSAGAAVSSVGAHVDVAAVTADLAPTWDQIAAILTPATRVVVLTHMRGLAAPDTPRIAGELGRRGVHLVEDCAQLRRAGVPCHQTTGEHDLHVARSWPAPAPTPLVDLRCYADISVPLLPEADHSEYLALLADLVARWGEPFLTPADGDR